MTDQTSNDSPLRDVAQSPEAYAAYLKDLQLVGLDIAKHLETLQHEIRVHCRGTHVEGDRWYHPRLRSRPVEKSLASTVKNLQAATDGLEKALFNRRAHDDQVKALPQARRDKAIAKAQKKNPAAINSTTENVRHDAQTENSGYSIPTSIRDLRDYSDRRSA